MNDAASGPRSATEQSMVDYTILRGVARIFQTVGGGGGFTVCQSEVTHRIVISFLPPVVGCLLKMPIKGRATGTPGPPLATPDT